MINAVARSPGSIRSSLIAPPFGEKPSLLHMFPTRDQLLAGSILALAPPRRTTRRIVDRAHKQTQRWNPPQSSGERDRR